MEVWADLLMYDNHIGPRLRKILDISFRVGNHEVCLKREFRAAPHGLNHQWPHSNIWHKVAIHDIDLDTLRACLLCLTHLFAEAGEIGRENGGN